MSLTEEEVNLITESWKAVASNKRAAGRVLFRILFTENPEIQDKFAFVRGLTWDEIIAKPTRLDAHSASVLNSINSLVENMDSTDIVKELLHKLGASHKPRGLTVKHLEILGDVLMRTFTELLGTEVMTEEAVTAWTKFYSVLLAEMGAEL